MAECLVEKVKEEAFQPLVSILDSIYRKEQDNFENCRPEELANRQGRVASLKEARAKIVSIFNFIVEKRRE